MNEKEFNMDFEINPLTVAILPIEFGEGKLYSKVYQLDEEFFVPFKPLDLIKKACKAFGASYEGRRDGCRHLVGITHKVPITIDSTNLVYFFPTNSPTKAPCAWISHEHVKEYKKSDSSHTHVTFRNNKSIVIPISVYSFEKQMLRTALLRTRLSQKIASQNRRLMYVYNNHSKASENLSPYGDLDF
ncbi:competence protein ComK [Niallia sp. Krafla_26]|uniref:competence protein ComK n=1 Tax=Niallia sp. Krafla_26 TaxID=3064703 RepID=UPI003D17F4BA